MAVHVKNAIQHEDFFITKCHQDCRSGSSGHFHCPICLRTTIKRQDTLRHLQICRPPLHDAQVDADADCKEEGVTSQTEEGKAGSVDLPHLSKDRLPASVHDSEMQGPGDPAERPQDPSPQSVLLFSPRLDHPPCRVPREKLPNVLCPHCNVQFLRKNLKKHLYRKHADKAVGDIAANSHADVDERDNKGAVKKSFLGPLLPLDLQNKTWGKGHQIKCEPSECEIAESGMAAAGSLPFHAWQYPLVHESEVQGPGDPAERPQDPSPESMLDDPPCRVPRAKLPNVLCPHCNAQLLRKNLEMHIYRKHRKQKT